MRNQWITALLVLLAISALASVRFTTQDKQDEYSAARKDVLNGGGINRGHTKAGSTGKPVKLDAPYVPTAQVVVDEMLKMADVRKGDVVYDLGCGDGRIVITAAQKYGARGFGVDIDPDRIRESRENARKVGVDQQVQFFQQDLFKIDVRPATMVALYLWPGVNRRLRPKLFRELKPGTRIVAHDFDMSEWQADRTQQVTGPNREHTLYYWVMPANVAGTWQWSSGSQEATLKLRQQYQQVSGTVTINAQETPISNAKLTGTALSFTIPGAALGQSEPIRFSGQADGHTLTGSVGEGAAKRDWKATRNPSTAPAPDMLTKQLQ